MDLLQSTLVKISDISFNTGQIPNVPKNPRFIKTERYEKLKKSLEDNPEMLPARELLVYNYDGELIVIGGNMRLRAAKELGYKEIPCKILEDLTPEQIRAIVIKDNVSFGSDDFEQLANEWNSIELEEWGLEVPNFVQPELTDYSDKNKEIDVDDLDGIMTIKLNYIENEYWEVKEKLLKIAQTPEQAVWKLLGND